jgi:hypothetical protein
MADVLEPVKVQELELTDIANNADYLVIASTDSSKPPRRITVANLAKAIDSLNPRMKVVGSLRVTYPYSYTPSGIVASMGRDSTGRYTIYLNSVINSSSHFVCVNAQEGNGGPAYASYYVGMGLVTSIKVYTGDDSTPNDAQFDLTIISKN